MGFQNIFSYNGLLVLLCDMHTLKSNLVKKPRVCFWTASDKLNSSSDRYGKFYMCVWTAHLIKMGNSITENTLFLVNLFCIHMKRMSHDWKWVQNFYQPTMFCLRDNTTETEQKAELGSHMLGMGNSIIDSIVFFFNLLGFISKECAIT